MAKFLCRCSHVIDLVSSPTLEQYTLVPNYLLYELAENVDKKKLSSDEFFGQIDLVGKDVIRCPSCSRVWIREGEGPEYLPYLVEN